MTETKDTQLEQIRRFHASHKIISILSQSKANVENLIDNLPDIFAIIDENGYIAKGNHILAKTLGLEIEELLGKSFSSLFGEIGWRKFQAHIIKLKSNKEHEEFELSTDNQKKTLIWRVSRFRENKVIKPLYCIIGTDITALREREKELEIFNENLQSLVDEKTQDIAFLLDSVEQGIISIDPQMRLNEVHSKGAEIIFARQTFSNLTLKDLFKFSDHEEKEFSNWYRLIKSPERFRRFKKYALLCPILERKLNISGEEMIITIEYKPLIKNDEIDRLMLLCTDVTDQRKVEETLRISEQQKALQMQRVLGLINNMQISLAIFFEEVSNYLLEFRSITNKEQLAENVEEIFRNAHTLKGNAGSFGFHELARITSHLEDNLVKVISQKTDQSLYEEFSTRVADISNEFEQLDTLRKAMFVEENNTISILADEYQNLVEDLKFNKLDLHNTYRRFVFLNSYPFRDYCIKYNNIIKTYREKFKKSIEDLIIETPDQLVHRDLMAIMDVPLIHIIRNAIDHGIESDDERTLKNKGPGKITIRCQQNESKLLVIVSDSGQGIDTNKVTERAIRLELIDEKKAQGLNEQEKIELIFATGLSTKDQVSSISGRGAGLGAARSYLEDNYGSLQLESVVNVGCTFTLTIDIEKILFSEKAK